MVKYYKKVASENWIQPVLTANGVIGANNTNVMAIAQISTGGTEFNEPYNATDSTGFNQQHLNGGLIIDFKKSIYIRSLTFSSTSPWPMPYKWTLYVSNDNINYISIGQFSAVPCIINLPQKYRYIKMIVNNAWTNGTHYFWGVANLRITGLSSTVSWQECTKSEYDQLPDDQRKIITDVYNVFVRNSQKSIYKVWKQPTLTSNGTIGGNSFAVTSTTATAKNTVFQMFDGKSDTFADLTVPYNTEINMVLYNPIPLNIKKIETVSKKISTYGYIGIASGNVYGSNDGENYTLIKAYTTEHIEKPTIDLSDNKHFYKYYKITTSSWYTPGYPVLLYYCQVVSMNITALAQEEILLDINKTYAPSSKVAIKEKGKEKVVNLYYLGGQ